MWDNPYKSPAADGEDRLLSGWQLQAIILAVLAVLSLGLVASTMDLPAPPQPSGLLLSFGFLHVTALLCVLTVAAMRLPKDQWVGGLYLRAATDLVRTVARAVMFVVPLILCINILIQLIVWVSSIPRSPNALLEYMIDGDVMTVVVIAIGAVVVAPVCEEFVFRVVLHGACREHVKESSADVITSLLFALLHGIPENVPALFVLAMILQRQLRQTRSVWVPILTHAMFNGTSVVILLVARYFGKAELLV
jgi:membrane protease YdiL (CAAX protease family)